MKRKSLVVALVIVFCGLSLFIVSYASPNIPISKTYVQPPISADDYPGVSVETGSFTLRAVYPISGIMNGNLATFAIPEGSLEIVKLDFAAGSAAFGGSQVDLDGLEDEFVSLAKSAKASVSFDTKGSSLPLEADLTESACTLQAVVSSSDLSFEGAKQGTLTLLEGFSLSNATMEIGDRLTAPARITNLSTNYKQLGNLIFAKSITVVVTSSATRLMDPMNVTVESTGTFVIKAEN
jgi:hypothetical protein